MDGPGEYVPDVAEGIVRVRTCLPRELKNAVELPAGRPARGVVGPAAAWLLASGPCMTWAIFVTTGR